MTASPDSPFPPAVVIGGMHRSGTSFVANLLGAAGLHLGDELLGANFGNPRGHFEDLAFFDFHKRVLAANGLHEDGFTTREQLDVPPALRDEARALVEARRGAGRPWGWKEPRTALFLDLWAELLPEARFVFVFRRPWEVVDSLFRRGDELILAEPRLAIDTWLAYNRRIRDFAVAHPDRALVCEVTQFATRTTEVFAAIQERLGVPLGEPAAVFDPALLVEDRDPRRAAVLREIAPEASDLYRDLRSLAAATAPLPDDDLAADAGPAWLAAGGSGTTALAEWARAAVSCRMTRDLREALDHARREAEETSARLQAEMAAHAIAREQLHLAQGRHADLTAEHMTLTDRVARLEAETTAARSRADEACQAVANLAGGMAEQRQVATDLRESLALERHALADVTARAVRLEAAEAEHRQGIDSLSLRLQAAEAELGRQTARQSAIGQTHPMSLRDRFTRETRRLGRQLANLLPSQGKSLVDGSRCR